MAVSHQEDGLDPARLTEAAACAPHSQTVTFRKVARLPAQDQEFEKL